MEDSARVDRVQGFGLVVLQVVVGSVFLGHGLQKILVFGLGGEFAGNLEGQG